MSAQIKQTDPLKAGIKAIKAAQRQLGLDDATYRAMLAQHCAGKTSATLLTLVEQGRVLDHMRRCGAVSPTAARRAAGQRRSAPPADKAALMAQLHTCLKELERITGRPHTMAYADAIAKRNGWADRVEWCTPKALHQLVGALRRTIRFKSDVSAADPAAIGA